MLEYKKIKTAKSNLIICGKCQREGKQSILGEVTVDGLVSVQRFHQGFTRISGSNFIIYCGECGEAAYKKNINKRG